jgi:polar amino acid transport system permease protein
MPGTNGQRPRFLQSILRSKILDVTGYVLLLFALIWLVLRGAESQGYNWQWYRVPQFIYAFGDDGFSAGPILQGLGITLHITWMSLILTYIIGLVTALLRLSPSIGGRIVARFYLETTRNTPLLVQLFFVYFIVAPPLQLNRLFAAVLALSLFEGSYASEIYRAGIKSIDKGQWEAGSSLGLNTYQLYRLVILPQAIPRILPPLTSQAVSLIKDSSLVSVIAVYEMTMRANAIVAETFLVFEVYFTIALFYLIITVIVSQLAGLMERKIQVPS